VLSSGLSERERRFCEEYVIDYNGKRAALAVGYAEASASSEANDITHNPAAIDYINTLKQQQTIRSKINADYVLAAIYETLERCRQEIEPIRVKGGGTLVVNDKNGEPKNAFRFDARNTLKAAELLGKHLAMFTDVVDNRMTFTKMPEVVVSSGDEKKELKFEVGSEAKKP
jgi:phage terminase small subunit